MGDERSGAMRRFFSINNIDGNLHAGTLGIGADDSPDLLCDATLTADDLAHVVGGDTQLQRQLLIALHLRDGDGSGSSTRFLAM